ncbi:MAG: glycosyltransferase family 2 protein [Clostridia bacterium]
MYDVLVSAVVPTYSRNETLVRAIESILNQTYKNVEVIVVDDNPSESEWRKTSEAIMQKYENNPRVRYIKNAQNLGGAGARNEGIKAAKGEYIAFLDDDDEYYPEKIEKQLSLFKNSNNPKLALVYCFATFIDKDGTSTYSDRRYFKGNCLYEAMEQNCIAATSQWLVKKDALLKVDMFSIVPCKQDSQLILKLLAAGYEVDCVKEELSKYYNFVVGDRISRGNMKNIEGEKLYRTECRKQYYKLEDWQILNVEYAFLRRFHELYKGNKMKTEAKHVYNLMLKLSFRKTVLHSIYLKLRLLKSCIMHK